jgi:hypothetical protein
MHFLTYSFNCSMQVKYNENNLTAAPAHLLDILHCSRLRGANGHCVKRLSGCSQQRSFHLIYKMNVSIHCYKKG